MSIEELVKKYKTYTEHDVSLEAALTEQAETHALELRAYEATVANLEQRIRELEAQRVPDGWKLVPVEPTPDMLSATSWPGCAGTDYKHMLAAAPAPKEGE